MIRPRSVFALLLSFALTASLTADANAQDPRIYGVTPANGATVGTSSVQVLWSGCSNGSITTSSPQSKVNGVIVPTNFQGPNWSGCELSQKMRFSTTANLNPGTNWIDLKFCTAYGCAYWSMTLNYVAPTPGIAVTPDGVTTSAIYVGGSGSYTFRVTNTGNVAANPVLSVSCSSQLTSCYFPYFGATTGTGPLISAGAYADYSVYYAGATGGTGVVTVTAYWQQYTGTSNTGTLNVPVNGVASVAVSVSPASILPSGSATATARAYAADGFEFTGKSVQWSTNSYVSVSPTTGTTVASTTVNPVSPGPGSVSATVDGVTGSAAITVLQPVASVVVTTGSTLLVGQQMSATARAYASNGAELSGRAVSWGATRASVSPSTGSTAATTTLTGTSDGAGSVVATVEGISGSASFAVVDAATRKFPIAQIAYAANVRDVGRCVASCFENVMSYSTPAWMSRDESRAVTLVYRSGSANPIGTVQFDVVDSSGNWAPKFMLQLRRPNFSLVQFLNGSTDLYFSSSGTNQVNRLVAAFNASSLPTGSYPYDALITSIWPDFTRTTVVPLRVIVLNEAQSAFGAGWTVAGLQRLHPQVDGILVTDGSGSASFFSSTGGGQTSRNATWTSSGVTLNGSNARINDVDVVNHAWHTDNAVLGAYLQLNHSSQLTFSRFRIFAHNAGYTGNYRLRGSNDGANWVTLVSAFVPSASGWNQVLFPAATYQFWRAELLNTPGPGSWLNEAELDNQCASGSSCTYTSAAGEFTTLMQQASGTYVRGYPDGTSAYFSIDGTQTSLMDRFGNALQTFQYDAASGRLTSITDVASQVSTITYAPAGGSWRPNTLQSISTPGGRTSWFGVDANFHLRAIQDPDMIYFGNAEYDADNRMYQFQDRRGVTWNFTYAWHGALASSLAPPIDTTSSGGGPTVRPTTTLVGPGAAQFAALGAGAGTVGTPVAAGLLSRATVTNPRGFATHFTISRWDAPTQVTSPVSNVVSSYEYSPTTGQITRAVGIAGHDTRYTWTGSNLTRVVDQSTGDTVNATYGSFNQIASIWGNGTVGRWFTYKTSQTGHPLQEMRVGVFNAIPTVFVADAQGRPTQITDPGGHITRMYYSASGFQNTDSTVAPGSRKTWHKYDSYGRLASSRGPGSLTRDSAEYDLMNRTIASIDMENQRTTLRYESVDLRAIVDPAGQVDSLVRNALGWVTQDIRPAVVPVPLRAVFDVNGNIVRTVDRAGRIVTHAYDALDRQILRVAGTDTARFHYVANASLSGGIAAYVVGQNAESSDTSFFDIKGRLKRRNVGLGGSSYTFDYTYNPNGSLARRDATTTSSWWSGATKTVQYGYNAALALESITAFGQQTFVGLNDENLSTTITYPNGLVNALSSTSNHENYFQSYSGTGTGAASSLGNALRMDGAGRVMEWRRSWGDSLKTYGYQNRRLTSRTIFQSIQETCTNPTQTEIDGYTCQTTEPVDHVENYAYDIAGNLMNGVTQLESGNRVRATTSASYTYDADGNLIATTGANARSLTWNALGQLASVTAGGVTTTFGYDAFGRRVRKTANGSITRYLLEGPNIFMEMNGSGFPLAEYASWPGIDGPLSVKRGTETYYFAIDRVSGSVRGLIRASDKAVVSKYGYTPFGVLEAGSFDNVQDGPNPLRFAAREFDAETGLYYFRSRYYDPQLGRFISEDPIGTEGGTNLYAYAGNDPINNRDPFGLQCQTITLPGTTVIVGAPNGNGQPQVHVTPPETKQVCNHPPGTFGGGFLSWFGGGGGNPFGRNDAVNPPKPRQLPTGPLPKCDAVEFVGNSGTIHVQFNHSNGFLQWGVTMHSPLVRAGPGVWTFAEFVGGQKVSSELAKPNEGMLHGSVNPTKMQSGQVFQLAVLYRDAFGLLHHSVPNACLIP